MTVIPQCGVTLASGDVAMYEAGARRTQIVAPDGTPRRTVEMPVAEAHGMTDDRSTGVDVDGSRYVTEWLIGGRTTKRRRLAA